MNAIPKTLLAATVLFSSLAPPLQAQSAPAGDAPAFTFALTGDAIITRKLSVYEEPDFLEMIELIRGADAAFTNLEMLFHDYEVYPAHQSGGTWMRGDPDLVNDLVWAGFDMVSRANNHTGDYGVEGMRLTTRYVEEAGLVQAGVGEGLARAREAGFLEAAHGRVALVSLASTFPEHSVAGETRGDMPPRPGLNPLRYSSVRTAPPEALDRLAEALQDVGVFARRTEDGLRASGGLTFVEGEARGSRSEVNMEDVEANAAVVNNAARLSDYVVVSLHAHESGQGRTNPADFVVDFAHAMIDAGASIVTGHGPHVLRGIEIYQGKPIFYSLGDFIFQNETLDLLPAENYEPYDLGADAYVADFNEARYNGGTSGFPADPEIWEGVIAMPTFQGADLSEIVLHPVTLGFGEPAWVRGRPMLARGELAEKILNNLAERSERFGTVIEIRDGVGYVQVR